MNGYALILGRAWLDIVDAYINCIEGNMTIANGQPQNKIFLYPLPSHSLILKYLCG
jgi:hypothetical protein